MNELAGETKFAASVESLAALLGSLQRCVDCVPNVERVVAIADEAAEIIVRPNLAFASGPMTLKFQRLPTPDAAQGHWQIDLAGIGSASQIEATFAVEPHDTTSCTLQWRATILKRTGLLRLVPTTVVHAAGQKIAADILASMHSHLLSSR